MIVARTVNANIRTLMTSAVRNGGHHDFGGVPGAVSLLNDIEHLYFDFFINVKMLKM